MLWVLHNQLGFVIAFVFAFTDIVTSNSKKPTFTHLRGVKRKTDRFSITQFMCTVDVQIACTVRINGLQNKSNAVLVHP